MWVEGGRDAIEERHRTVFVTAESTRGVEPVGSPGSRSWRRTGERGDGMYLEAGGQRFRDRAPESDRLCLGNWLCHFLPSRPSFPLLKKFSRAHA